MEQLAQTVIPSSTQTTPTQTTPTQTTPTQTALPSLTLRKSTPTSEQTDIIHLYRLGWSIAKIAEYLQSIEEKPYHTYYGRIRKTLLVYNPKRLSFEDMVNLIPFNKIFSIESSPDNSPQPLNTETLTYDDHLDFVKQTAYYRAGLQPAPILPKCSSIHASKKHKLTSYDVYLIQLFVCLSWKKNKLAKIFNVTPTLITTYTYGFEPYSGKEIQELISVVDLFTYDNN